MPNDTYIDSSTGQLVRRAAGSVAIMLPWPGLGAWRQEAHQSRWHRWTPDLHVSASSPPGRVESWTPAGHEPEALWTFCSWIPESVRRVVAPFPSPHWHLLTWIGQGGPAADGTLGHLSPRALEQAASFNDTRDESARILADTMRMWRLARPAARLPVFDRFDAVADDHDTLVREVGLIKRRPATRDFPDPPFPGSSTVVPVTSQAMLLDEGREQHNCVGSYGPRIRQGHVAVYRVLSPERATLSLVRRRGQWQVEQLKASCNKRVRDETRVAVLTWLRRSARRLSGLEP